MAKKKAMTEGERQILETLNSVNSRFEPYTLSDLRNESLDGLREWRWRARRIDRAINKAAWDGYYYAIGVTAYVSPEKSDAEFDAMVAKYGPRPTPKKGE